MPDTYRVLYTTRAADELQAIFTYIETDSPQNAATMIDRILKSIEGLELLPHRFGVLRGAESLDEEIRSMPVRPYLVRYHINDQAHVVTILSVRHGARNVGPE